MILGKKLYTGDNINTGLNINVVFMWSFPALLFLHLQLEFLLFFSTRYKISIYLRQMWLHTFHNKTFALVLGVNLVFFLVNLQFLFLAFARSCLMFQTKNFNDNFDCCLFFGRYEKCRCYCCCCCCFNFIRSLCCWVPSIRIIVLTNLHIIWHIC